VKCKFGQRNLRKRTVSAPENDDIEGQSHGLSELDEIDCEFLTPNKECAIAVLKRSTRQEGNMSGNMKEFLLPVGRIFKAGVATAMETVNSDFKTEKLN
jgi:hypothetical protein